MNPPRRNDEKPTIDRLEWDFSACSEDELMLCCFYEYFRSSPAFYERYLNAVENTPSKERSKKYWWHPPTGYGLSLDCPEFPIMPWLKIASDIRKQRLKPIKGKIKFSEVAFSPSLEYSVEGFEIDRESGSLKRGKTTTLPLIGFNEETGDEVATFEIRWGFPETKIVEDFKRWVKANHPQKQKAIRGEDAIRPKRLARTARRKLNALAAWRLLELFSWEEAAELTQNESDTKKSLFGEQPRWITAKKDAEFLLFGPREVGEVSPVKS